MRNAVLFPLLFAACTAAAPIAGCGGAGAQKPFSNQGSCDNYEAARGAICAACAHTPDECPWRD